MSEELSDEKLNNSQITPEAKAYDLLIKGHSMNFGEKFNQDAFDLLSKAIKLNPYLIEAWIELTKCYQRKADIDGAIACLENALKYCDSEKPNKILLRKLSTCVRQKNFTNQEAKIAALLRSLELSKQALKSDLYDEENYYNLAKAYMCLFFVTECVDRQLINLSKAAYMKALVLSEESHLRKQKFNDSSSENKNALDSCVQEDILSSLKDPDEHVRPFIEQSDFLFNFSTVLVYLQEFQPALGYLRLSIKLDPEWTEPKVLEECLVDYLRQINSMLNELTRNNKKVVRRYSKIVETLKETDKIETIIKLDQRRLLKSEDVETKSITLEELEKMDYSKKSLDSKAKSPSITIPLLHLKLVSAINYNQAMYLTFIAIDQNYSLTVVTIYNIAASRCPTPRDIVTLVEPKSEEISVNNVDVTNLKSCISFKRINVKEFRELYVNGSRITTDQVSKPNFTVSVLP